MWQLKFIILSLTVEYEKWRVFKLISIIFFKILRFVSAYRIPSDNTFADHPFQFTCNA